MGQPAPAGYYQNNLIVAFRFVLQRYRATLPASYALSLDEYLAASGDGQRLLARLLTRKGPYFLRAGLEYSEIDSTDRALTELTERGLLCREPGASGPVCEGSSLIFIRVLPFAEATEGAAKGHGH